VALWCDYSRIPRPKEVLQSRAEARSYDFGHGVALYSTTYAMDFSFVPIFSHASLRRVDEPRSGVIRQPHIGG
jgi:hypothetical protein